MATPHDIQSLDIRTTAARGRETERVGPFLATFDPDDDLRYPSYAIPDDGAEPGPGDVAALIEAYRRRARVPRGWSSCRRSRRPWRRRCSRAASRSRRGCRS